MSGYDEEKKFVVAEARRKWSAAERRAIVEETKSASVSSVARKHGVATSLLFRWRRDAGLDGKNAKRSAGVFLPVVTEQKTAVTSAEQKPDPGGMPSGTIEIELVSGHKLRVLGVVRSDALKQVIAALI